MALVNTWHRWRLQRRLRRRQPDYTRLDRVLVLCTANRVRSPFAAHYLRRRLPPSVVVSSRGVLDGGPLCPTEAIDAAALHGIDLSRHVAQVATPAELMGASLVLTMELRMAHELAVAYPALERIIVPLGYYDEAYPLQDIDDPFLLPPAEYVLAYDRIARCCDGLLHHVAEANGHVSSTVMS